MSIEHPQLNLAQYREMAENWSLWRDRFGPVKRFEPLKASASLALVSQDQGTWELTVAVAAYAMLRPPPLVQSSPSPDLSILVRALDSQDRRVLLPGFAKFAPKVTTLPFTSLMSHAPHLHAILEESDPLTAMAMSCADFCLHLHPNDPQALIRCIREC